MTEIIPGYFVHTPDEKFGPYANIMEADTAAEKLMSEGVQVLGITKEGFEGVVSYEALEYSAESFTSAAVTTRSLGSAEKYECPTCKIVWYDTHTDHDFDTAGNPLCPLCAHAGYVSDAESFGAEENEMCPSCERAKISQDHDRYLVCPLCDWRSDEPLPCRHLNLEITDTDYDGEFEGGVMVYARCEDCYADGQAFGVWEFEDYNAESFSAEGFVYFYTLDEDGFGDHYDTLEEAQAAVAASSKPMEIHERREDIHEPYKMDKRMGAESELTMRHKRMINRDIPEGEPMMFCEGCGERNEGNWESSTHACNSCFDGWMDNFDHSAESKLPPVEKAGITGVASGATMEGLETLLATEDIKGECEGCGAVTWLDQGGVACDDCQYCEYCEQYHTSEVKDICYEEAFSKHYEGPAEDGDSFSAEGDLAETQEELAEVRTELSKTRTGMSFFPHRIGSRWIYSLVGTS